MMMSSLFQHNVKEGHIFCNMALIPCSISTQSETGRLDKACIMDITKPPLTLCEPAISDFLCALVLRELCFYKTIFSFSVVRETHGGMCWIRISSVATRSERKWLTPLFKALTLQHGLKWLTPL